MGEPEYEEDADWALSVVEQMRDSLRELVSEHETPLTKLHGLILVTWGKATVMVFVPEAGQSLRGHLGRMPPHLVPEAFQKEALEQFDTLMADQGSGLLPVLIVGFDNSGMHCARLRVQVGEGYAS